MYQHQLHRYVDVDLFAHLFNLLKMSIVEKLSSVTCWLEHQSLLQTTFLHPLVTVVEV